MRLISTVQCPVSGRPGRVAYSGATDSFYGTEGLWVYRKDHVSGHLWLDPRPADEDVASLYDQYYTHEQGDVVHSLWERALKVALHTSLRYPASERPDWRARLLARMPSVSAAAEMEVMRIPASERGRLLDYGCGSGLFLRRMRSHGWYVSGIEPDTASAARVSAAEGFVVRSSIDELLADCTDGFDVLTMSHVIEHLPDPIATLRQLRPLLAKNGRVIVATPNAASLGSRVFGPYWRGLEPPRHFNIFTLSSMDAMMTAAGFRIVQIRTDVRLARGIWFLSALARKGGRNLELGPKAGHRFLKVNGYLFQLAEAALRLIWRGCGEEIFCVAVVADK